MSRGEADMARALAVALLLAGCGSSSPPGSTVDLAPLPDLAQAAGPSFLGTYHCTGSQAQTCQGGTGSGTYNISAACPMVITAGAAAGKLVVTHANSIQQSWTVSDAAHAALTPETLPGSAPN